MKSAVSRLALVPTLAVLALLVGCDHATKLAAKAELEGHHARPLIHGVLDLHYVENTDVAFNLLRWMPDEVRRPVLFASGGLALLALAVLLLRRPPRRLAVQAALLLVTAGAAGNYLDRLARGYVVDFVHLHHWPVFNVADVYVTAGAALLALTAVVGSRGEDPA
ncbi:MAG TPA: signal peptidase II [Polyangia bacterium]|nr:signal peptidase II [Polyangia bacterium]